MAASPLLGLTLQAPGTNINLWGQLLNDEVFTLTEQAIAGVQPIALTGNLTLTSTNAVTNQVRKAVLILTAGGGLVAAPTVTVPNKQKLWLVVNQTGFAVTFTCGGVNAVLPIGRTGFIICNGVDLLKWDPTTDAITAVQGISDAAAASATAAAASAAAAVTSASNAAASAAASEVSRQAAGTSATNAAASASQAADIYDAFDDRYLGAKAADPAVDNDGNALLVGAIYFNTTANEMRVRNSVNAWQVQVPDAGNYYTKGQADALYALGFTRAFNQTLHYGS